MVEISILSSENHTLIFDQFLFLSINCNAFQLQSSDLDVYDSSHGLMVRTFNYLFERIKALNNNDEICKIKASYLEIYNEKAIDLLNQGSKRLNLPLRWNKQNQAFTVENLFVFSCSETQDLVNILVEGEYLPILLQ